MSKFTLIALALAVTHLACMPEPPERPEFGGPPAAGPAGAPPSQSPTDQPPSGAEEPPEAAALPDGLTGQDVLDALGAEGLAGVSAEEAGHYADTFARLDDGDGEMTEQEFVDGGFFPEAQARLIFAASDINQDGVTVEAEYIEHRAVTDEAKIIHADLDVDASGGVSLDELAAAVDLDDVAGVFASADADGDGAITMIELLRAVGEWTWGDRR